MIQAIKNFRVEVKLLEKVFKNLGIDSRRTTTNLNNVRTFP